MIEKHVISLELAKRLKDLGVKQESIFYWCRVIETNPLEFNYRVITPKYYPFREVAAYSAYTASELMEIIPLEIIPHKVRNFICKNDGKDEWVANDVHHIFFYFDSEDKEYTSIYVDNRKG